MSDDAAGAAMFCTPAEAYDRFVGRYGRALARALIAAADVRPGGRALDVGCEPGALTTELAALLGAGHVAAVDPSASFADACRQRLPADRAAQLDSAVQQQGEAVRDQPPRSPRAAP